MKGQKKKPWLLPFLIGLTIQIVSKPMLAVCVVYTVSHEFKKRTFRVDNLSTQPIFYLQISSDCQQIILYGIVSLVNFKDTVSSKPIFDKHVLLYVILACNCSVQIKHVFYHLYNIPALYGCVKME